MVKTETALAVKVEITPPHRFPLTWDVQMSNKAAVDAFILELQASGLSVMSADVMTRGKKIEVIPTGLASFDQATGVGGLPRSRCITFYGPEAAGKTMLALLAIATIQRKGGTGAVVDAEHALTPSFCELLGVNYADLVVGKPENLEEAFELTKRLTASNLFDIVCFDSIAGIASKDEIEAEAGSGQSRAPTARICSQELRKLAAIVGKSKTCVILINQLRDKPDATAGQMKTEYMPGGRAIKHHSSMIVLVKKREPHMHGKKQIGHRARVKIEKNKVAAPYGVAEFDLYYASGIDRYTDLVETSITLKLVELRGSTYYFDSQKWAGKTAFDTAVRGDKKLAQALYDAVMSAGEALRSEGEPEEEEEAEDEAAE